MLVLIGAGVYIILTSAAMFMYAGGTYTNPDAAGYSFLNNFFSDLGRTESHSGEPNTISWILFTSSIMTIGIAMILFYAGLTPSDLLLDLHLLFVRIGFISVFIASIIYSIVLYKQTTYPRVYLYTILVFTGVSLIYIILLFFGPSTETDEGLFIQVVGQKLIVYIMAIVFSIQGYGALKIASNT
jgi:hypothetical membrane protein